MTLPNPSYPISVASSGTNMTFSLHLRPYETSSQELSRLLTALFGSGVSPAVGLIQEDTVYPLSVVCARPDAVAACTSPLKVLFATSPTSVLLAQLEATGKLRSEERALLDSMRDDAFVVAAMEVYEAEGDLEDLVDTLQRIAVIKRQQQGTRPGAGRSNKEEDDLDEFPTVGLTDTLRGALAEGAVSSDDGLAVVELINKQHPALELAFKDYVGDGDWSRLVEQTAGVAQAFSFARFCPTEELLELFRAKDARVWAAWDVFVDLKDEADFADSLKRVSQASVPSGARATEAKDVLRRLVVALHVEGKVDDVEGQALRELVESGSPTCEALANKYLRSAKAEVDAEALARGVLDVLRQQDELLSERMRALVLDMRPASDVQEKLLGLIDARDERVLEAFDAFYHVVASGGSHEEGLEILAAQLDALAKEVDLVELDEEAELVDEEEGDDEEDLPLEDGIHMLFKYIANWGLSDDELRQLREMLASKEPSVSRAIDAFANNKDAAAFKEAMIKAVRGG